jgi:hypothetical protein
MAPARAKKASTSACSNPLQQTGLLELVFSFLGREGIFVQTVSKDWQALYNKMILERDISTNSAFSSHHTSYKAVFASASRMKLALACDLQLEDNEQRYAGRYASVDTLRAAFKLGLPRSVKVATGAARSADLSKLIWLRTKQHCLFPLDITATAAAAGSAQMLQWLTQRRFRLDKSTSLAAASRPRNMPALQCLHENGCEWHDNCCGRAGATGDVVQLQWLRDHGAPLNTKAAYEAAMGGCVPVFEILQQEGVAFNSDVMHKAAEHGHLQLCQWLHTAGCNWDVHACTAAARRQHLETLRWLHESGCPWHAHSICRQAVTNGNSKSFELLQYMLSAGELTSAALLTELLLLAGAHEQLAVAKWLRQRGAQWPAVLCFNWYSIRRWSGEVLAWAREGGCTSPGEPPM